MAAMLVVGAAGTASACSGGGGGSDGADKGAFCDAAEEYAAARAEVDGDQLPVSAGSPEVEAAFTEMVESAPESFRDSLEAIADVDPTSADEASVQERDSVLAKVNTFVREGCELDITI